MGFFGGTCQEEKKWIWTKDYGYEMCTYKNEIQFVAMKHVSVIDQLQFGVVFENKWIYIIFFLIFAIE